MPPAEAHLAAVLAELGWDQDPACAGTPERVAELWRTFVPGPAPTLTTFEATEQDPVVLRGLPFYSLCAHHLLPFFGTATIAYRPASRIAGLGAFPRLLRHHARRPQLQERLGADLAEALHDALRAPILVRLRARHLCMELRGVESPGEVETVTRRGPVDPELAGLGG